jgi:hypothetical protein
MRERFSLAFSWREIEYGKWASKEERKVFTGLTRVGNSVTRLGVYRK